MQHKQCNLILWVSVPLVIVGLCITNWWFLAYHIAKYKGIDVKLPVRDYTNTVRIEQVYDIEDVYVSYKRMEIQKARITKYTASRNETDKSPAISASNRLMYEGACAISNDLVKKYNMKFGDLVYVKEKNKWFVFEDKMHPRIEQTIDLFSLNKKEALKYSKISAVSFVKINRDVTF
jgi:3D (Asp-Asp-Asp) domain-containing protein